MCEVVGSSRIGGGGGGGDGSGSSSISSCRPLTEVLCEREPEHREEMMRRVTLRHCPHLALRSLLCQEEVASVVNRTVAGCCRVARHLQDIDSTVGRILAQHQALLDKYDCDMQRSWRYSITQNCSDCKVRQASLVSVHRVKSNVRLYSRCHYIRYV